jgi:Holliday junction resolvase RusA-like endonuclease
MKDKQEAANVWLDYIIDCMNDEEGFYKLAEMDLNHRIFIFKVVKKLKDNSNKGIIVHRDFDNLHRLVNDYLNDENSFVENSKAFIELSRKEKLVSLNEDK